jgi:hypothetical protein
MWLAVTSIALASAIVFNVIALCLIDWFEKNLPEILIVHTAKHEFSTIRELGTRWAALNALLIASSANLTVTVIPRLFNVFIPGFDFQCSASKAQQIAPGVSVSLD